MMTIHLSKDQEWLFRRLLAFRDSDSRQQVVTDMLWRSLKTFEPPSETNYQRFKRDESERKETDDKR